MPVVIQNQLISSKYEIEKVENIIEIVEFKRDSWHAQSEPVPI